MDRFARVVLGYHGCEPAFAEEILRGDKAVKDWKPSANEYDWLGHGIYFWEYAPERAKAWDKGGVIGAVIQLGHCVDFTDIRYTKRLAEEFDVLKDVYAKEGKPLQENKDKRRDLDCLVINYLAAMSEAKGQAVQSVRCPFLEGVPAFPGSAILVESHVQIAVRDSGCILGVFRPTFLTGD